MVFTSAALTSVTDDGQHSEDMKRSGTQVSLKELISPFGQSKRKTPAFHDSLKQSTCLVVDVVDSINDTSKASSDTCPRVIVGPEHVLVRRRSRVMKHCDVSRTDATLPFTGAKFARPEYSDAQHSYGLRETPYANESRGDSSSQIQIAPFHETSFPPQNQDFITTHSNKKNRATMSSPSNNTYKTQSRRSRSIAIKNPQHTSTTFQSDHSITEEESASNERMYDWATWRMYNRIIDHRRNQQLYMSPQTLPEPPIISQSMIVPRPPPDYLHDGEVFELEI